MTNGWSGPDPGMTGTGIDEELSTRFVVHADITVTAIRVYSTASTTLSNRNARFWTTAGVQTDTIDIDDTLPNTGWTTYPITPKHFVAGDRFDVSYSVTGQLAIVPIATTQFPRDSSDGAVTAALANYQTIVGSFPINASTSFFGIDIVYTNNTPAVNANPVITGMSVAKADLTVNASVNLTDETPASVVVTWEWGDGSSTTTGAGVTTAQHTYSTSGIYAVLATATDTFGAQDAAAQPVQITVSLLATESEEWLDDILDAVVSDAQRSGYFDKVNTHEPKRSPGTGLKAAVWVQAIDPIPLASGLASTSARIVFMLRIYSNMLKEPQDAIDPEVMKAVSNLMRRYHDDFDFEGTIRNVDLLGSYGVALAAQSGYLEIDGANFRIMDITIPCLVNDVWPQIN